MPQSDPSPNPLVYPQWSFGNLQDPRALQEHQLSWYTIQLETEACEHNATRAKLQRYIAQALSYERALCAEKCTTKHLYSVIIELRDELAEERMKLARAEEELRVLQNILGTTTRGNASWNGSPIYEVRALKSEGKTRLIWNQSPTLNDEEPVHLALSDEEMGEMENQRRESNPKYTRPASTS